MSSESCGHRGGNARGQRTWGSAFHRRLQGADARQHRRGLWRHRHPPALRVARSGGGRQQQLGRRHAAGRARRAQPDPVGADRRRHAEIRADPAARRQPRRRRDAGADGAGAARRQQGRRCDRAARHHLRRAVLRRRGHHAGAVGAIGDRRHQARHRDLRSLCRAAHRRHSGAAVRRPVARHRQRRGVLRPGDVRLVRGHLDCRRAADRAASRSDAGAQSALCRVVHDPSRHHRFRDARRGVPRRHRRRGALCGSGSFRQTADPDRMAVHRAAVAGAELSGAGRARDRRSQGDRKPVLPDVPGLGADPDGRAGDAGDRDREPGRHHRRLFADPAGDPARPDAAVRNSPYLGSAFRPDLHPAHQHDAA